MKGYYIEDAIIERPMDLGFPDRWDGYVICNDEDTAEEGLCKKFGVQEIFQMGEFEGRPVDGIPVLKLTVGELRIVMCEIMKG
jgi:hypothetical protein